MLKLQKIVIFMSNDREIRKDYLCVNDTTSTAKTEKDRKCIETSWLYSSNRIRMKERKSVFAHTFWRCSVYSYWLLFLRFLLSPVYTASSTIDHYLFFFSAGFFIRPIALVAVDFFLIGSKCYISITQKRIHIYRL